MATYPGQALPLPGLEESKALNKYKATGSWWSQWPSGTQIHCSVGTMAPGVSTVGWATFPFLFLKATYWEFCGHIWAHTSKMPGSKSHSPWQRSRIRATSVGLQALCSFTHTREMTARPSGADYSTPDGHQSTQPLLFHLSNGKDDPSTPFHPAGQ